MLSKVFATRSHSGAAQGGIGAALAYRAGAPLEAYQSAIDKRLAGNDDAISRWNACARILMSNSSVVPAEEENGESMLE